MAPSNLQGLNIVHPPQPQNPYLSDQDLLSVPPFPDLSAQLDLWTNLNFQSDEPLISDDETDKYHLLEEEQLQGNGKIADSGSHENVVTGTVIPSAPVQSSTGAGSLAQLNAFDIGSLLASFGVDPFQVPTNALQMPPAAPSLAQLLSYHT
ncbi:hypothetical protein BDW22DRAFT_1335447, partial [Trametopsis cervina]